MTWEHFFLALIWEAANEVGLPSHSLSDMCPLGEYLLELENL